MKLSDIFFIGDFPTLDLHGYDRDSARVKIKEFVHDNYVMQKEYITIIHGIGTGALRKETQETLRVDPFVEEYQLFRGNVGCTIAKIKKK